MRKFGPFFLLLCTIISGFYFIGVLFFLTDHEPYNKCEMTYMFEYPQYVKISQRIDHKYPKYGLYAYGEGRMTKKIRNMHFDGIPVLFIPGNAGSYQQVRSLSSVALRKALNSRTPYHFDYFSVDLNAEFSALYGPVLYDQTEYILSSIDRILELYKNSPNSPKQVILIGHSIGGVIAKKVTSELLRRKKNVVSCLITLAAPMKRAPIYFDRQVSGFYKASAIDGENIITISIAGGYSDILVPSYLTKDEGNNSLNLVSTNIPKAWIESNHVQILWCKQIVLVINRALFDIVDQKSHQISNDPDFIKNIFKHNLIHNSGTMHHLKSNIQKVVPIDYKGEWIESLYKQYSIEHKKGLKQPHWYMVAFTALPTYEMLTVLGVNLEVTDWVFVCNAAYPNKGGRVCVDAEHLTQYSEIVPTSRFKRRLITLNMHELRKNNTEYTHVVFRALPTSEPVTFHVDIYGSFERKTVVLLPRFSLRKQIILTETPEKALVYELVLPQLTNLLQVYQLFVEPTRCSSEQHQATASLIVPWANEHVHTHFTEAISKPLVIRLQNAKVPNTDDARIRLILEPTCTYKISIRLHILGFFGQIVRYYSPFLISYIAVIFLLAFQTQFNEMSKTGILPIFFTAVIDGLKQSWILVVAFLLSKIRNPLLMKILPEYEFSPFPDGIETAIVPLILFMVSIFILVVLVAVYCVSLFTLESTVHKVTLKLLARTVTLNIRFSNYFMTFLQKVPCVVAVVLIALCFLTCGGLALCVGLVFYFLKLTQMSQDYVEQVAWFILKKIARKCKKLFSKNKKENKDTQPLAIENTLSSDPDSKSENSKDLMKTEQTANKESEDKPNSSENDASQLKDASSSHTESIGDFSLNNNALYFHSSMFFIWVIVTILNVPAVLTWAHNFKFSKHLIPDESFYPGLVLSLSALPLWQLDLPTTNRKYTYLLRIIMIHFSIVSLLYATVSVYRLNYMLTILFALIMLQQCYAPKVLIDNEEASDDMDQKQPEDKYDELKKKLD